MSKKAKSLLIPFFVVTMLYAVPMKYVTGYFVSSTNPFKDILVGQVLCQGNTHLWFLPTLFLIFLLVYTLEKFIKNRAVNMVVLFALACLEQAFSEFCPVVLINNVAQYAFWFYLGYCFEAIRPKIKDAIGKKTVLWVLGSLAGVVMIKILSMVIPDSLVWPKSIIHRIWISSICFFIYVFSVCLAQTKLPQTKMMKTLRENTLGMYLYSDPLNYVLLFLATQWLGSVVFASNVASAAFILARFLITSGVSLGISVIIRKCRLKYLA